jgi:hypothetical protein
MGGRVRKPSSGVKTDEKGSKDGTFKEGAGACGSDCVAEYEPH